MSTMSSTALFSQNLFQAVESHPYSTDFEYQSGLAAILGHPLIISAHEPQVIPANPSNRDLHLRARCFYYARKHPEQCGPGGIDFDAYSAWRAQQPLEKLTPLELTNPPPPPGSAVSSTENTPEKARGMLEPTLVNGTPTKTNASQETPFGAEDVETLHQGTEAQPASFQEVMELIKEGKPIPGIKDIPDTVLEGQGTASTFAQRRKPWERDTASGVSMETRAWQGRRDPSLREMFPARQSAA